VLATRNSLEQLESQKTILCEQCLRIDKCLRERKDDREHNFCLPANIRSSIIDDSIKIRGRDEEQNENFKHCTNVREHEFIILNANFADIENDSRDESTVEIAEVSYCLLQDVNVFILMM